VNARQRRPVSGGDEGVEALGADRSGKVAPATATSSQKHAVRPRLRDRITVSTPIVATAVLIDGF
jgi:hypothetical protein